MLNYEKEIDNRLDFFKEKDFDFFVQETGLSRLEINRIFKVFKEKGKNGVLNKAQFKDVFEELTRYWLGHYKNSEEISDLIFRAFDKDHNFLLELHEFLEGCAVLFISKGDKKTKLEYIFDLYDVNLDGYLSLKEIESGFRALFRMIGADHSDSEMRQLAVTAMKEMGIKTTNKISNMSKKNLEGLHHVKYQNPRISKELFIKVILEDENVLRKLTCLYMQ